MQTQPTAPEPPAEPPQPRGFAFSRFRLERDGRHLLRDGELVPLTSKAFDTLWMLVSHHERMVSKDELMRSVWRDAFVSEDSLTQNISVLRRALGDDSANPAFIATIARRGYRFIAPVLLLEAGGEPSSLQRPIAPVPLSVARPHVDVAVPATPVMPDIPATWRVPALWVGVVAVLAALAAGIVVRRPGDPPARLVSFSQDGPEGTTLASGGVLSPDGRYLAFVARDNRTGDTRLWVRHIDVAGLNPIEGTEGASRPFWSPDGQFVGFFAGGRLKRVGMDGMAPRNLAPVGISPMGGTWNVAGQILFGDLWTGLYVVSANGGTPAPATTLDREGQERSHRFPQFLPDGRRFLFTIVAGDDARSGTWLGRLDSPERTRLLDASSFGAQYAATGHLLFVRDGTLMAQGFAADRGTLEGEAVPVAGGVTAPQPVNGAVLSAASFDLLTYGGGTTPERLLWFSRAGARLSAVEMPTILHNPAFLDGTASRMIGASVEPQYRGVWAVDLERGVKTRLMTDGNVAVPSPDGSQFVFQANRGSGVFDLFVRPLSGAGGETLLVQSTENKIAMDWSRDGRYIIYVSSNPSTKQDLWVLPTFGDRAPGPLLATPFNEIQGRVSPDGRWLAYASDESGNWDVYVQSFPTPGSKQSVSVGGGAEPQWRSDGRELFYVAADGSLMAVDVQSGPNLLVGRPQTLFKAPISGNASMYRSFYRSHYAVSPAGDRFLMAAEDAARPEPITVLVNWRSALRR